MKVNECETPWCAGISLAQLRAQFKPEADIVVLNGFPVKPEDLEKTMVWVDDQIVLIKRGEIPAKEQLEALLCARHTPGVYDQLRTKCVGIAGVGGLGSNVALALARVGVGTLIIADHDVIEPSNLNRQAYRLEQIGRPKVEALAQDLESITPLTKVISHPVLLNPQNIQEFFETCQVVVECFDQAGQKQMLVETILTKMPEITVIAASGLAGTGDGNTIITRQVRRNLFLVGDGVSEAGFGMGLMAPRVLIAAGHQANTAVRILLGDFSNAHIDD